MPLPAPRILLGAVALLLVCAVPMHTHAYSAQLFESSNCSPTTVLVYADKLKQGSCVAMGPGASAKVKCDSAGSAFTSLYLGNDCQVLLGTGRGVGDGVTCGVIRFTDGSGPWSGYVDCSAPGPDPAISDAAKNGIIAGCVVGGLLLLAGAGWWCYKRQQTKQSNAMMHSMSMQQQHPQQHGQPALQYAPSGAPTFGQPLPPGAMMALVCCVALLLPVAPVAAAQLTPEGVQLANEAALILLGNSVMIASAVFGALLCCCPVVFLRGRYG